MLEWKREQFSLDVALRDVRINEFPEARRTALFVEPTPGGYARVNLAEVARQKESEGTTAIRESLPVPEPSNRVRLKTPLDPWRRRPGEARQPGRAVRSQGGHAPAVFSSNLDEVVGASRSRPPGIPAERTASTLSALPDTSIER